MTRFSARWPRLASVRTTVLIATSLLYAYGALVHVANMLSLSGFDWSRAPLKWQALDVIYLVLDLAVVAGLWRPWRISIVSFYAASASQLLLYTLGRTWILDVGEEFAEQVAQADYLWTLVGFHLVALVLVTWSLGRTSSGPAHRDTASG